MKIIKLKERGAGLESQLKVGEIGSYGWRHGYGGLYNTILIRTNNDILSKTYTVEHKELIKILDKHYLNIKIKQDEEKIKTI